MEWYWNVLILFGIWILCGFIAVGLGYMFFHEEGDKIKFWNIVIIIALGLIGLLFTIDDIDDMSSYRTE